MAGAAGATAADGVVVVAAAADNGKPIYETPPLPPPLPRRALHPDNRFRRASQTYS